MRITTATYTCFNSYPRSEVVASRCPLYWLGIMLPFNPVTHGLHRLFKTQVIHDTETTLPCKGISHSECPIRLKEKVSENNSPIP